MLECFDIPLESTPTQYISTTSLSTLVPSQSYVRASRMSENEITLLISITITVVTHDNNSLLKRGVGLFSGDCITSRNRQVQLQFSDNK